MQSGPQLTLHLRLLGPPETMWVDQPLEIGRRQPRAILYRLATRLESVPRAQLCMLLWPDVPEPDARRNLSNQVYNLRRALPDRELLKVDNDRLALSRHRVWSDVATFGRLCQSSESVELQQAVDLYRGPFLEGFSLIEGREFSLWMDRERRDLERRYLETLSRLTATYAVQGNHDSAIACARRYLEIDDLAEDMHRQLIDLYTAQGNRSAALRQYERCVTVLERELGVEPLPETQEVYQAALAPQTVAVTTLRASPQWTTLPSLEVPLIGRDEALNQLRAAYSQTCAGVGAAVLVSGEAGVGKSRLLEEFVTEISGEATVVVGSSYEAEVEMPYLPVIEALRPVLPTIDWRSLEVDRLHLSQLVRLLPELRRFLSALPEAPATESEEEASSIFQGLAHLVLSLARQYGPLVLCLDDLQWSDETTRSWVGFLGRRLRAAPMLLLGGFRKDEARAVSRLRASLARLNVLEELELRGLTEQDVRQLIRRLSNLTAGYERFSRQLHRLTGGNPFFLLEILRTLFEAGLLHQEDSGWHSDLEHLSASLSKLAWPDSVAKTVQQRLGRLSPSARQVLEAGAVIGRRFYLDLVQATSGRSEQEVVDALEELESRQLITVSEDRYQFRHDLIQAIVSDGLTYGRRRLLHRRAGEALEKLEPDDPAALARHFAEAEETHKAATYAVRAGDRARIIFAYQEAVELYHRALKFQKKRGALEAAARTLMRLGLTYQMADDYALAQQAYEDSFALRQQILAASQVNLARASRPLRLFLYSAPQPPRLSSSDPLRMDPGTPSTSDILVKQIFSGLLRTDVNWTIRPEVARAWEITDDGHHYLFHLREDALWSDGKPVTAHDFEFAWKRILALKRMEGPGEGLFTLHAVRGARAFHRGETDDPDSVAVRATDPFTLEVDLEESAGTFLNLLTDQRLLPVPRHMVESLGNAWTEPGQIVTNGPFLPRDWKSGEGVVLTRNPTYFGRYRGNLEQVVISNKALAPAEQLRAYGNGEVDILCLEPETFYARFQYVEEYQRADVAVTYYLRFAQTESPFHDRRVRQAFGLVIDKDDFARETVRGFHMPATGGLLPPGFPGHSPGIGLRHDPDGARNLMRDAGYPDGRGFPRVTLMTVESRVLQAKALQRIWEEHLGIQVEVDVKDWSDFHLRTGQAQLLLVGLMARDPDPYQFLRAGAHFHSNYWRHPAYERLIREAIRQDDQGEALGLLRRAESILIEEAAIIPILYGVEHYLVNPGLKINLPDYSLKDAILDPR